MRSRDAALDGIRAFAALGVWLLHVGSNTGVMYREGMYAWMMSRLGIAVPVFFVLSGLLLYRPWARAVLEGGPRPRPLGYLWRRVLRVMPAYWLVTGLALWAWSPFDWTGWAKWMLLAQNYFPDDPPPDGLYQMWTLPVEMSFYVLLPVLAWALHRWARAGSGGGRPLRLLAGIAVLPVVSVATVVVARVLGLPQLALWLPYHLVFFACGMAMAVLSVWLGHSRVIDALAPQLLVLALLLYAVLSTGWAGPRTLELPTLSQSLLRVSLEAAVAVLVVAPFALAARPDSLRHRVVGNPVTAYLGRISYSFFLWHAPVITLQLKLTGAQPFAGDFTSVAVVSLVVTTLLSVGTHHLIELPALRLSAHRSAPAPPPAAPAPAPVAAAP
ncbi:acyltransferase family protein [Nonomuraea jiangxiensis]|uniref:Peptidoglycan/LPS O-acetylase OafA/YrhL, contains acyltransferase and SGNH-hydrolase domains n=1 Tax=Nonomuraea jiangxiensis TaxID=633440 RepID=A0A1G8EVQ1_9ACTN|nr:acyltransferase [Nonomuraea jiangxiensis]SDH73925.1 Peptidoglycan/LPS O-acetylase OafA/YrhL, contains acyltransferase and SGNH-hydrolase domains [Nonomuraea jiangxiensis]